MNSQSFAVEWIETWNARDLEKILSHYAPEIEFTSPVALRVVPSSGGTIHGIDALRSYWSQALSRNPELRFELHAVLETVSGCTILYHNQRRQLVAETVFFDERGQVTRSSASYGAIPGDNPT